MIRKASTKVWKSWGMEKDLGVKRERKQENASTKTTKCTDRCDSLFSSLTAGEMKASLFAFVFHVARALLAEVVQHLRKYSLKRLVPTNRDGVGIVRAGHGQELVIGYVYGSAVAMARVRGGVSIAPLQIRHVIGGAQDGGDDELVGRQSLRLAGVDEIECDGV